MSLELPWWASLKHGGLLLSAPRLAELFTAPAPALPTYIVARLRGDIQRLAEAPEDAAAQKALLDTVLHDIAGLRDDFTHDWQRGNDVQPRFARRAASGEMVKPRRVFTGPHGALLPVFVDEEPRLGIGRGRRSVSRVVEWCRGTGHPLALLTNARQFRLLHVAAEHDAFCEWDTAQWFEGGQLSPQVEAWQYLLAPALHLPPQAGALSPLLDAIRRSRQGQSQLTSLLGERVRQAVEVLIHAHTPYLNRHPELDRAEVYRAANLVVMRLVVGLFAEARDLFPRSNRIYETSYGLQGLWEKLARASGGQSARLRTRYGAWPQVLALFRLIHDGSPHGELSVRAYGGELFRPGTADAPEGVRRAMHLFETACYAGDPSVMSDAEVHTLLDLLTRCAMPVRQGRSVTTVTVPVDFADLSTEYIGILYEGLLDYELHQVPVATDDPVLFINLGDQPALPLSRLEALTGPALKTFFKEFAKSGASAAASSGEEQAAEDEETDSTSGDEADPLTTEDGETITTETGEALEVEAAPDTVVSARQRALAWARRAVVEAQLVKAYTGADPGRRAEAEERIGRAANQLVARTILPGDFFLVRWGGTRKGQGSFYTRPGLVAPTVQRTLAPLCYELPAEPSLDDLRDPATPRSPSVILELKVCDPATGSASFPVSALRYLAEALWRSLLHHTWLVADETAGTYLPGPGLPAGEPAWFRECVRDLPGDLSAAEGTIRARLKRLIVERCLYGVDLDPLAIELARLSLWIETMDRDLPFGFLDHKFKCGNGLVGCWFGRFQDYPALALHRPTDDAGDKTHTTGVHLEKGRLSDALKTFRDDTLKPALVRWIEAQDPGVFAFLQSGQSAADLQLAAIRRMEELHALPVHETEARAAFYRDQVQPALAPLRAAFDVWCALWFWPVDDLAHLPLPGTFTAPTAEALAVVARLRAQLRFFHWELEFPDVFTGPDAGFHAILGNPPWETLQPTSKEWFSNHDPLYRTYGKQEALRRQRELFTLDAQIERDWVAYCAEFKALSNWCANAAFPWADPADEASGGGKWSLAPRRAAVELHRAWRARRALRRNFSDRAHAFRHQGEGKPHTYKLFLEQMLALMRPGGRLGVIVPSNVYTDKGSTALRRHFLDRCRWEWIFGIENRDKIFDIHRSFKFCPIIVQKGGVTVAIRTAFMRRSLHDWAEAERHALPYAREQVTRFSPKSLAILELRSVQDAEILDKMYRHGVLLGDDSAAGWGLRYRQGDFNMTSDSKLFPPRPVWEEQGYQPDEYGQWLRGAWRPVPTGEPWVTGGDAWLREPWRRARSVLHRTGLLREQPDGTLAASAGYVLSRDGRSYIALEDIEDVALPLYEGRMIDHFDFSSKGWVSGKGRTAVWRDIPWENKVIEPQYLMGRSAASQSLGLKISFLDIGSATNARSMVASAILGAPCGNVAPILTRAGSIDTTLGLAAALNCFAYDFAVRLRLGGLHLNYFVIEETPLARVFDSPALVSATARWSLALNFPAPFGAALWAESETNTRVSSWPAKWALTEAERARGTAIIEALMAHSLCLNVVDYAELLRDCDHPSATVRTDEFARTLDPKGFWRVDKEKDPELRHTVLAQVAFQDLQRLGLDAFLAQNDGEGWQLPATLRLADYGLGHDARARDPQPVASRLGPRFHPWQLEGTVEQSWQECHRHAALIRAIRTHGQPAPQPAAEPPTSDSPAAVAAPTATKRRGRPSASTSNEQTELF
jgi:hypothetical protein